MLAFLLILLTGLGGCSLSYSESSVPTPIDPPFPNASAFPDNPSLIFITSTPDGRVTPTPFLPLNPTAVSFTPTPEATPSWGGYPGPSIPPAVAIPEPAERFRQPAGQVNFLLLGSDQRPDSGGFRTDTIVLVTLNPNLGTVHLTSFPRDLYVYIPGWTMQRINTAHAHGGFELTQATFEYNLGVKPDHFVLINFWGFTQVVNSLGGIFVNVAIPLQDHRDGYGQYYVPPGQIYMDGDTALWYVRARKTTSDFDRTRRQQEVLVALFNRLISLDGISRAPELYDLYRQNVVTDAEFTDAVPHLGLAAQVADDPSRVSSYFIGRDQVTSYTTPGGAAVLLPSRDSVLEIMRQALNAPE